MVMSRPSERVSTTQSAFNRMLDKTFDPSPRTASKCPGNPPALRARAVLSATRTPSVLDRHPSAEVTVSCHGHALTTFRTC